MAQRSAGRRSKKAVSLSRPVGGRPAEPQLSDCRVATVGGAWPGATLETIAAEFGCSPHEARRTLTDTLDVPVVKIGSREWVNVLELLVSLVLHTSRDVETRDEAYEWIDWAAEFTTAQRYATVLSTLRGGRTAWLRHRNTVRREGYAGYRSRRTERSG